MKIPRRKQSNEDFHPDLVVKGGAEGAKDKRVPTVGAGIAIALTRALDLAAGGKVIIVEYGDTIYTAIRDEEGASIYEGSRA